MGGQTATRARAVEAYGCNVVLLVGSLRSANRGATIIPRLSFIAFSWVAPFRTAAHAVTATSLPQHRSGRIKLCGKRDSHALAVVSNRGSPTLGDPIASSSLGHAAKWVRVRIRGRIRPISLICPSVSSASTTGTVTCPRRPLLAIRSAGRAIGKRV